MSLDEPKTVTVYSPKLPISWALLRLSLFIVQVDHIMGTTQTVQFIVQVAHVMGTAQTVQFIVQVAHVMGATQTVCVPIPSGHPCVGLTQMS